MGQPVVFAIGNNHEGRYAMFESIKALIPDLFESARPRTAAKDHGSWLATAVLLTRVATVHDEMSAGRRERLYTILKSAFQLDDLAAAQLIDQSAEVARNAVDLYRFTRKLREVLDDQGCYETVRMMWEIVYADGTPNEFEANIIWRAADLLGVSSRQRVALRQLVLADKGELGRVSPSSGASWPATLSR
jgi:uncharacterized tellurite resistance protein B-like protein